MKRLWVILFLSSFIFSQNWATEINYKFSPAVTSIEIIQINGDKSFGSGFNVDKGGLIVTNYHVVKSAKEIIVKFKGGDRYKVEYFTYVDEDKDFAILKIAGFELPIVKLGNSDMVQIGNEIVAIGHPEGAGYSMTDGIISQIRSNKTLKLLQISAYIGPGSSGGPLFNYNQEVIGVTTSGLENTSINFAIPINYIRGAMKASHYASKKKVGYDIKEKTISNKRRDWSPPARASGDIYKPRTPVYKPRNYFYTFSSSYFLGSKSLYNVSLPKGLDFSEMDWGKPDKNFPIGWSIGLGLYNKNPIISPILQAFSVYFDYEIYNILYMYREYSHPDVGSYMGINEVGFDIELGRTITKKISYSFGYGISFRETAKVYYSGFSGSLENYNRGPRHRALLALNYSFSKIRLKLEYIQGLSRVIYSKDINWSGGKVLDAYLNPPNGIRFRLEIPIKNKFY